MNKDRKFQYLILTLFRATKQVPLHAIKTKEMGASGFGIIDLYGNGGKAYDSSVPHRHTFFELLLFTQAQGKHEIDFNHYPVENNSVHFVSPGQIHRLNLKKIKVTLYVLQKILFP